MKQSILLIGGAVLTLLFILFSAPVFELLYYEREFSNEMYNQSVYLPTALILAAVAWGVAGLFYYVINSVRFSRWYHWLVLLVAVSLLTPMATNAYADSIFTADGYSFSHQLGLFGVMCGFIEAVLFTVASFAMRWWSSNCRHTPIPE